MGWEGSQLELESSQYPANGYEITKKNVYMCPFILSLRHLAKLYAPISANNYTLSTDAVISFPCPFQFPLQTLSRGFVRFAPAWNK